MTLQKIEFECDIPDGYRFVRYGVPKNGDKYISIDGAIHASISDPVIRHNEWMYCDWYFFCDGKENPNWRDTLIDLDKDDYEFEDGILRRIEK